VLNVLFVFVKFVELGSIGLIQFHGLFVENDKINALNIRIYLSKTEINIIKFINIINLTCTLFSVKLIN